MNPADLDTLQILYRGQGWCELVRGRNVCRYEQFDDRSIIATCSLRTTNHGIDIGPRPTAKQSSKLRKQASQENHIVDRN